MEACELSNVLEFIDQKRDFEVEETAQGLLNQMIQNENEIIELIGKEKYDEEMDVLNKIKDQEAKNGEFAAIVGDIDSRSESEKGSVVLSPNFEL